MSSPHKFAKSKIKFNKIDDLPKDGIPASQEQVMRAMSVLYKMIHAQSLAYGGKNSKLLPAGIAESLLKSVTNVQPEISEASIGDDLDAAYMCCDRLQRRLGGDEESVMLLLDTLVHVNRALSKGF